MRTVLAYLDPITGSALVQVFLGLLAAVGLGWQYVKRGFRSMRAAMQRVPYQEDAEVSDEDSLVN